MVTVEAEVDGGSGTHPDRLGSGSSELAVVVELQLVPEVSENGTVTLTIGYGLSENQHYGVSIESLQDQLVMGSLSFRKYIMSVQSNPLHRFPLLISKYTCSNGIVFLFHIILALFYNRTYAKNLISLCQKKALT